MKVVSPPRKLFCKLKHRANLLKVILVSYSILFIFGRQGCWDQSSVCILDMIPGWKSHDQGPNPLDVDLIYEKVSQHEPSVK